MIRFERWIWPAAYSATVGAQTKAEKMNMLESVSTLKVARPSVSQTMKAMATYSRLVSSSDSRPTTSDLLGSRT